MRLDFRQGKKLQFHHVDDLSQIFCVHSVAPHEPVMLWPVMMSTSILLYVDWSKIPFKVHFLDVSRSQPEPAQGRNTIHTLQRNIRDICFDTNLLVVAAGR